MPLAISFTGAAGFLLALLLLLSSVASGEYRTAGASREHSGGDSAAFWGRKVGVDSGTHAQKRSALTVETSIDRSKDIKPGDRSHEVSPRMISRSWSYTSSLDNLEVGYTFKDARKRSLLRLSRLPNTHEENIGLGHRHQQTTAVAAATVAADDRQTQLDVDGLLDGATDDISTMLSKDYGHKPRSRTPVHNQQRLDHQHADRDP